MTRAEELLQKIEEAATVKVPSFKTADDAYAFIRKLQGAAKVADDVVDPDTGEVIMSKGQSKKKVFGKKAGSGKSRDIAFTTDEFDDIYQYTTATVSKITGEKEREGYDLSIKIPYLISRKDGFALDDLDMDAIQDWLDEEYGAVASDNGYELTAVKAGKRAQVDVEFIR